MTNEEKAAYAAGNISVVDKMELDGEIVLPVVDSVIDSAAIAWAITEDTLGAATLNENTLTIALKESAGVLKLTATVTVGEATETKVFEIALSAKTNNVVNTVVFADKGYENAANVTENVAVDDVATISFSDSPKYYTSGSAVRFYEGDGFTVTVLAGYEIVSVELTLVSADYNGDWDLGYVTVTGGTATVAATDSVILVTAADGATSVVITNINNPATDSDGENINTQLRVVSVKVTYAPVTTTTA